MLAPVPVPHETSTPKSQLFHTLRDLLRDSMRLRNQGCSHTRLATAQGYADGFMRALIESGIATERELLQFVIEVRRDVDGPAVGPVAVDLDGSSSAAA